MSDTVIKVENLSKKYLLHHHQQQEKYSTLRDAMTNGVKYLGRKVMSPFSPKESQPSGADEEFYALRDVSFAVKQGDRVGIIGRNGAGKSTLLKIMSRITEPTSGKIEITGRVASLLEVGTGFHPELTGRENIFLNGAILGMSKADIKRRFDEIVAFAEVEKFLDTPVKHYSSGMYVRLAFAVAAHLEPDILIVDEVLAVGDSVFQGKCISKMNEFAKAGSTIFFVSHNLGMIRQLCTHAIYLEKGGFKMQGSINEVIDKYIISSEDEDNVANLDLDLGDKNIFVINKFSMISDDIYTNKIRMGKELIFEICYTMIKQINFLKIGIKIVDSSGFLCFILSPNQQYKNFLNELTGDGKIKCLIPAINLMPGYYKICLDIAIDMEKMISLENICSLHVIENDVFLTGLIPSKIHGMFYLHAKWDIS